MLHLSLVRLYAANCRVKRMTEEEQLAADCRELDRRSEGHQREKRWLTEMIAEQDRMLEEESSDEEDDDDGREP